MTTPTTGSSSHREIGTTFTASQNTSQSDYMPQTRSSNVAKRNDSPLLKERIACIFKTGANFFARTFLSTAIAFNIAASMIGGLVGAGVGIVATSPQAGLGLLIDKLTSGNLGTGQFILNIGTYGFCRLASTLALIVSTIPAIIAGIGLGLTAVPMGLARGAYDVINGDISRLSREGKTIADRINTLPEPNEISMSWEDKRPFGLVRQFIGANHRMLKQVVWA